MKKFIIPFFSVFFISCSNNAKIQFDNIDLGKFEIKDTIYGEAKIQNIGNHPLKISKVVASCECTTTGYDSSLISQGNFAIIKYKIFLKSTGHFSKTITFSANTEDQYHSFIISGVALKKN